MVAAVAQKTVWKMSVAQPPSPPVVNRSMPPISAPVPPNIRPKPKIQKIGVPSEKSIRFFIMMLPAFFARVKPVSTMAKPACIKKTSAAPNRIQPTFRALPSAVMSFMVGSLPMMYVYFFVRRKKEWCTPCAPGV